MVSTPSDAELDFKRKHLPNKPGCYLFKDSEGEVLYVGKAKSLKHRVNSYWQDRSGNEDPYYSQKIRRLIDETADLEVFIVENEMEALILENELIKEHQPTFNVRLKDSKSYPWVQITNEKFPRIRIIRMPEQHGRHHKYIGPFVDIYNLRKMLRFLRKIFPYCTCKRCVTNQSRSRPCVYYQINLCPAPCVGKISETDYKNNIRNIEKMLLGYIDPVKKQLKTNMETAAQALEFEKAAIWRDRIQSLDMFTVEQSILSYDFNKPEFGLKVSQTKTEMTNTEVGTGKEENSPLWRDMDIIAGHYSEKRAGLIIIHVRRGRLLNKTPYIIKLEQQVTSESESFLTILKQHYLQPHVPLPQEIILGQKIPNEDKNGLLQYFEDKKKEISFRKPLETDKTAGLLRIAQKNIALLIRQKDEYEHHLHTQAETQYEDIIQMGLEKLASLLDLENIPSLIEGFDMSHNQGQDYVGSKVALRDGKPHKSAYRRYRIRDPTITGSDDTKAMLEVMERRYSRAIKENQELPDLIVVDGGSAQLNIAHTLLESLGLEKIPHIGLVKPPGRSETYLQPKIILPDDSEPLELKKGDPALKILQTIRDESHRFAIKYHRKLREKRQSKSELDNIPGIGNKRKRKLLRHFKSVQRIKAASEQELIEFIGPKIGSIIFQYFKQLNLKTAANETHSAKKFRLKKKNQ